MTVGSGYISFDSGMGTLTLNGIMLNCPAWSVTDLKTLQNTADLRGADRIVSHVAGMTGKPRRRTGTRKDLPMVCNGHFDRLGNRYSDPNVGWVTNTDYLEANTGIGLATGDGTVTALWTRKDGTTKTAAVHVIGFRWADQMVDAQTLGVLTLSIPAGRFT